MPAVNPSILTWARQTAGLSLADAASAIGLNDAYGKTGAERLAELEAGDKEPSRSQLKKMSSKYRRSLLVFYLDEPPRKGDRGQDFRMLPSDVADLYDANLDALIRDLKTRQGLVKSLLEDEEAEPLPFIGSMTMAQGYEALAESIISTLGFSLTDFRKHRTIENAFTYLRRCIDSSGIFVLLVGDLGSYHTAIPIEVFRGFAIADKIAPFVVINNWDTKSAWAFTALHEIAHLWLGNTGVSGTSDVVTIERFCNNVAGAILLPPQELDELGTVHHTSFDDIVAQVSEFADARNISRMMVAYNLYLANFIGESRWEELRLRFHRDRIELKELQKKEKEKQKEEEGRSRGPDYYKLQRHRLGTNLLGLVDRSVSEGSLSPTKAGKILGVRTYIVKPLLSTIHPGASS